VPPADLDAVREAIRQEFGYVASFSHFPIVGLCAECAEAARRANGNGKRHLRLAGA
jgi:hypothetical protein